MTRKIIIDCDPGIDDAVAIAMALFDPRLEVLAITAAAGSVEASQATSNVTGIVGQLDPPRYPRIGKATPADSPPVGDDNLLHGPDGLGGLNFEPSGRQHQTPSEKVISELVHQHPNSITLVCLGPLTNLARLCQRDPNAIPLINNLVISGGSVNYPGNASPIAEHNMFYDPQSADLIFESATTKSLVPLDVTAKVQFGVELLDRLPARFTRTGSFSKVIRSGCASTSCQELIPLYDPTALMAVLEPELFQWSSMRGRVEHRGSLTRGATVFDQRLRPEWPVNMEVATATDTAEVQAAIIRSLRYAGQES